MTGALRIAGRLALQTCDPFRAARALRRYASFFDDYRRFQRMSAGACRLRDLDPQLHDRTADHGFDAHYLYMNSWAMRRILGHRPGLHVDVGGQPVLAALLSAAMPVVLVDYRPLHATIDGLQCVAGDAQRLPFRDASVESLSCLHVAEHIGLGRYGDGIDPEGTVRVIRELSRVLAPGGNLFFALPVGMPRVCFNAHRIHAATTVRNCLAELELLEHSGVHDDGRFVEMVSLGEFGVSDYACGFFWFAKP